MTTTLAQPLSWPAARPTASPGLFRPAFALCRRELVRFLRQRHRIIGAFATPIVFWLLIGGGMAHSFHSAGETNSGGYMEYFFPGTVLMILLFTAIFSTISIIEDRREGFLQSVLVAPVPRLAVVLGKVLGGSILAFGQAFIFLLLAPTVGIHPTVLGFLAALLMLAILSFGLTALGFCIAWRMSSTQGFHAIMNLFLMPMWFLSGALFPPSGAAGVVRAVMEINPLTYGLAGMREALYWGSSVAKPDAAGFGVCVLISGGSAIALLLLAGRIARRRVTADLH